MVVRILMWHVHGAWTSSFVRGRHEYLLPVTPTRDPNVGLGRAESWDWPPAVREVPYDRLRDTEIDLVLLQRPHELDLCTAWSGRTPGRDIPAVYVEHNTPRGDVPETRHPLAGQDSIPVVHITSFNDLFWNCDGARTTVIGNGIPDPGDRYSGELARAGVAINEPIRRGRITGTDLLPRFATAAPLDVFGMVTEWLPDWLGVAPDRMTTANLAQDAMHTELAKRRVYIHPFRWTSLGMSLVEAMYLGMPVVALAATEALHAVPPEAGVISTDVDVLVDAVRRLVADPEEARRLGRQARDVAQTRFGLDRFLDQWHQLLTRTRAEG
ncbi:glycosyltransferase [Saccharothrix sp. AJ9571]|nr:glycosyltransferase [Saccharothrix sp. AJ9571]